MLINLVFQPDELERMEILEALQQTYKGEIICVTVAGLMDGLLISR